MTTGPGTPDTDRPRQPRLLDRVCGGCGRGPGPVQALLPVMERVLGAEHPETLTTRHNLARWTGQGGMRPGPGTSSPPCCPSASGFWGAEHPETLTTRRISPGGPGRRGMRRGPATSSPSCCPSERVLGAEHPDTLDRPAQPRPLDRGGGGCGGGPRPVRRASCPSSSGLWAPSTPIPWPTGTISPSGPGRRGMRPGPGTSSPLLLPDHGAGPGRRAPRHPDRRLARRADRCPSPTSPGPARRGMRPGPATRSRPAAHR